MTEPKITVTGKASNIRKAEGAIDFRNICFSYGAGGNGTPILKDISFAVKKGLTLGIVGRTGAGKSTLVSLIPRLYDVTEGEILFDGQDIRTVPLPLLRRSIGFVSQDPFLFSTTLSRNIKFGSPEVSEDAIAQAASLAQLGEDLKDFPLGYDTPIGERGLTLSGGQKQRTAIARALILNPEILILDDALSSVDFRTEQEILAELKTILKQRTSIIISNRVSVLKDADEILVLDTGEIVERGTHPSLLARGGVYTDLFHRQELSEELERY